MDEFLLDIGGKGVNQMQQWWKEWPWPLSQEQKSQVWEQHQQRLEMGLGPQFQASARAIQWTSAELVAQPGPVRLQGHFESTAQELKSQLLKLKPWRKGPFQLGEVQVQTEWDSWLKWQRILELPLEIQGKDVLDLGCGNGYYMWKMLEQNPRTLLGLDPSSLFHAQFQVIQQAVQDPRIGFLAVGSDQITDWSRCCDLLFCMGVLYHRKSPLDFLSQLRELLRPGGQLVLETLILDGEGEHCLWPYPAYAKMKNCYMLPTKECLEIWLKRSGFKVLAWTASEWTSPDEQRASEWMDFQSLEDFLHPENPKLTCEGYQAPLRIAVLAEALR